MAEASIFHALTQAIIHAKVQAGTAATNGRELTYQTYSEGDASSSPLFARSGVAANGELRPRVPDPALN